MSYIIRFNFAANNFALALNIDCVCIMDVQVGTE